MYDSVNEMNVGVGSDLQPQAFGSVACAIIHNGVFPIGEIRKAAILSFFSNPPLKQQ